MSEALKRAAAYHEAGADGILIHSAKATADEVLGFRREWADRCPVVIVPTKYYAVPTEVFRDAGFSIVVWANQILRSALTAMQATTKQLVEQQHLRDIEHRIASVAEVFRLQGADELEQAEGLYLPKRSAKTRGVILAAARGKELGDLTKDMPKAMVRIGSRPLLEQIVDGYNAAGITSLSVVRGYRKDTVNLPNLSYVDNDDYETTGELYSLRLALSQIKLGTDDLVVSYGDVIFRHYILEALVEAKDEIVIAVDAGWQQSVNRNRAADYVMCSIPNSRHAFYKSVLLRRMAEDISAKRIHGEWIGMLKVSQTAVGRVRTVLDEIVDAPDGSGRTAKMLTLFNELVARGERIRVIYTTGHWLDVDEVEDVIAASNFD